MDGWMDEWMDGVDGYILDEYVNKLYKLGTKEKFKRRSVFVSVHLCVSA